jgi:hypothetical protein
LKIYLRRKEQALLKLVIFHATIFLRSGGEKNFFGCPLPGIQISPRFY